MKNTMLLVIALLCSIAVTAQDHAPTASQCQAVFDSEKKSGVTQKLLKQTAEIIGTAAKAAK